MTMALTPDERKRRLGFGGLSKVARITRRSLGHVSQVNSEKRADPVVERAIVREITRKHADIGPADIWPMAG
jgi:hypothetical protein